MSERADRIRAQQAGVQRLTLEQIAEAFRQQVAAHDDHPWEQVGRCVYCGPCRVRLFHGRFDPTKHEVFVRPKRRTAADDMRARWGMDRS